MCANRQNLRDLKEIGVEELDGDIRFETGSRNTYTTVSRMRNEKLQYNPYSWPNCQIFAFSRKLGSRNMMVTSDFSPEVEIRPFRACTMKNMQYSPYLWPNCPNFRVL